MSARSALYVPGDRPDRFDKAVASGADVVVLDLEDAVGPDRKDTAREAVCAWLAGSGDGPAGTQVRVNPPTSDLGRADLAALPAGVAVRVPKVESPDALDAVGRGRPVHALLESALGVEQASAIASHSAVRTIGLGEADLAAELGLATEEAFDWIRSRVVVAAAAAGLPPPMMSVFANLDDLEGLERSCRRGRSMGMWGRAAIHPQQVPVIDRVFTRTSAEKEWAATVLTALADGAGVARLPSGAMVDEAMARRARRIIEGP